MGLFSKFTNAITVDTKLHNSHLRQGDMLRGEIHLKGEKDTEVYNIQLKINIDYKDDDMYKSITYHTHTLVDSFYLNKGDRQVIPFEFQIPSDSPISSTKNRIYLKTDVNSSNEGFFEKEDKDYLDICPQDTFQFVLNAIETRGFRLQETEIKVDKYGNKPTIIGRNFLQELDFKPSYRSGHSFRIDEFEVALIDSDSHGNLLLQFSIEKHARSFGELLYNPDNIIRIEVFANKDRYYYEQIINDILNRFN